MRPEDIPQDAWDAARAAYAGYGRAGEYDVTLAAYELIARAILAERERCARVAEDYQYEHLVIRERFAALIRKGEPPSGSIGG